GIGYVQLPCGRSLRPLPGPRGDVVAPMCEHIVISCCCLLCVAYIFALFFFQSLIAIGALHGAIDISSDDLMCFLLFIVVNFILRGTNVYLNYSDDLAFAIRFYSFNLPSAVPMPILNIRINSRML